MNLAVLLAARNWSSRLKNKATWKLAGRPVLAHVIDRFKSCDRVTDIVVCTSPRDEDDAIARVAADYDVPCHRSTASERADVVTLLDEGLRKYAPAADLVHRGMVDCPLFEPDVVDLLVDNVVRSGCADVAWVGLPDDPWPIYGARESPWSRSAWNLCVERSTGEQREHAGSYIYENLRLFRVVHVTRLRAEYYRPYRLELDTPEDLAVIKAIFDALYHGPGTPTMLEAIKWLDEHPDVAAMNADVPLKSITKPDWRRRGMAWKCEVCGATPLQAMVVRRGALETLCPRCGQVRRFVEARQWRD